MFLPTRYYQPTAALGGTRAFHPIQLPDLVALCDISDLSTLFEERTGASASTPASVDGVVGTVLDLSGNGHHGIASSDAARSILRRSGGFSWVESDGVDDNFDLNPAITTTIRTFAMAFRPSVPVSDATNPAMGLVSTSLYWALVLGSATSHYSGEVISGGLTNQSDDRWGSLEPETVSGDCVFVYRDVGESGRDARQRLNGVDLTPLNPVGNERLADIARLLLRYSNDTQGFSGRMYAFLAMESLISDADLPKLELWLTSLMPEPQL